MKLSLATLSLILPLFCPIAEALGAVDAGAAAISDISLRNAVQTCVNDHSEVNVTALKNAIKSRVDDIGRIQLAETDKLDSLGRALLFLGDVVRTHHAGLQLETDTLPFYEEGINAIDNYIRHKHANSAGADIGLELKYHCLFFTKTQNCADITAAERALCQLNRPTANELTAFSRALRKYAMTPGLLNKDIVVLPAIRQLSVLDQSIKVLFDGVTRFINNDNARWTAFVGGDEARKITVIGAIIEGPNVFIKMNALKYFVEVLADDAEKQNINQAIDNRVAAFKQNLGNRILAIPSQDYVDALSPQNLERRVKMIKQYVTGNPYKKDSLVYLQNNFSTDYYGLAANLRAKIDLVRNRLNHVDQDRLNDLDRFVMLTYDIPAPPVTVAAPATTVPNIAANANFVRTAQRAPANKGNNAGFFMPYSAQYLAGNGVVNVSDSSKKTETAETTEKSSGVSKKEDAPAVKEESKSGMSRGMKIGVGVGVAAAVVVVAAVTYYFVAA